MYKLLNEIEGYETLCFANEKLRTHIFQLYDYSYSFSYQQSIDNLQPLSETPIQSEIKDENLQKTEILVCKICNILALFNWNDKLIQIPLYFDNITIPLCYDYETCDQIITLKNIKDIIT